MFPSFTQETSERGCFRKYIVETQVKEDIYDNIRFSVGKEIVVLIPETKLNISNIFFDLESWQPFLEILEKEYAIRYSQHFTPISNAEIKPLDRNFYEQPWPHDGGLDLYKRYLNSDHNSCKLLEFGWKIVNCSDSKFRLLPPSCFVNFAKNFIEGLRNSNIKCGDVTIPSLIFKSQNDNVSEFLIIRIFDTAPNPTYWKLCSSLKNAKGESEIDLPLQVYSLAMVLNRPPLNPIMFDHDNAHMIDNYNHLAYMKANILIFEKLLKGEIQVSQNYRNIDEFKLMLRIGIIHEELVLPDISYKNEIIALLDEMVYRKTFELIQNKDRLTTIPLDQLENEALRIATLFPNFTLRHGGGMNDPYNLHHELKVRSTPKQRIHNYETAFSIGTFPLHFHVRDREMFSQFAIESLLGMIDDIKYILETKNLKENQISLTLLIDRLARIEIAYWNAIKLSITGDLIASDSINLKNSNTEKWFKSFTISGSLTNLAFNDTCWNCEELEHIVGNVVE